MTRIEIRDFRLKAEDVSWTGEALARPECVLCEPDGTLWIGDRRGAFTRRDPDGTQTLLGAMGPLPNGMAMDREGRLLVANLETGVLFRVERDGRETAVLDEAEGQPLGSLNFAYFDPAGRAWLTISTRTVPRKLALDEPRADGLLLRLHRDGEAEVVARDFFFANEVRVDRAGAWLYIAETTAGRIRRAPLSAEGALGAFEPFGPDPLWPGARTDGIAFDCEGNLWATEISRNALVVLTPDGEPITVWQDAEGALLRHPTSVAFGGPDLRTVYVGSLVMERLFTFRSPIAGEPMYHWRARARPPDAKENRMNEQGAGVSAAHLHHRPPILPSLIRRNPPRAAPEGLARLAAYPVTDVSDAVGRMYTMAGIAPLHGKAPAICGNALTVKCPPGDNLGVVKAIAMARPGDVLVIDAQGFVDWCLGGHQLLLSAVLRGALGFVVNGAYRDASEAERDGLALYGTGVSAWSGPKAGPFEINVPVCCGGVIVEPGDAVHASADGVVVAPRRRLDMILAHLDAASERGALSNDREAERAKVERFVEAVDRHVDAAFVAGGGEFLD